MVSKRTRLKRKSPLELQSKITMPDGTGLFVRLIQQTSAIGNIPIILNDGLGCNGFIWKHFIDYFQHHHPIIHWHYRGHGYSDIPEHLQSVSIHQLAQDIQHILDHLQFKEAILCGHSMGVQVALQAFERKPERFKSLILLCGSYEHPLKSWHGSFYEKERKTWINRAMQKGFPLVHRLLSKNHKLWQPLWSTLFNTDIPYQTAIWFEVNRHLVQKEDFLPYFEHLSTMKPHIFLQMMKSYAEHSARKILPQIQKPTLIISGGKDTFSPHWVSLDMQQAISDSELLFIPDGTHCSPIEHPELIKLRVEKFLCLTPSLNSSCKHITGTSTLEAAWKPRKRIAIN